MEEKIEELLSKYDSNQIQSYYLISCVDFTLNEIDTVLPIVKNLKEGYDQIPRDTFLARIKNATSDRTMKKIYHVLDLCENYYQFKIC